MTITIEEFGQRRDEAEKRLSAAKANLIAGAVLGNVSQFFAAYRELDQRELEVFRIISRLHEVHPSIRLEFFDNFVEHGDAIRSDVGNDLVFIDGLKKLLPAYDGPDLVLYRGDSMWNRKRRAYGVSWTSDRDVALQFAHSHWWRGCEGGSVVLMAEVPASAIICAPALRVGHYGDGEAEYIVDRRRLAKVKVLERLAQVHGDDGIAA